MQPHEERVVVEKKELDEKLAKLEPFLNSTIFLSLASEDQGLLNEQCRLMMEYSDILRKRIARFNK